MYCIHVITDGDLLKEHVHVAGGLNLYAFWLGCFAFIGLFLLSMARVLTNIKTNLSFTSRNETGFICRLFLYIVHSQFQADYDTHLFKPTVRSMKSVWVTAPSHLLWAHAPEATPRKPLHPPANEKNARTNP